jgi:hypothetical protein
MAITSPTRQQEQSHRADEYAPMRLPRVGPRWARAPGRRARPDLARRPEPVPMWIAPAAARAAAATEAALRDPRHADHGIGR